MRYIRLKIVVLALICSVPWLASHAESPGVRNCTWCHGSSAKGYLPAPRLAGQHPQYLENQLVNFSEHTRDNPLSKQYMWGAAGNLSPLIARDLARYFSMLSFEAANDGYPELAAAGKKIYEEGIPESNIVSCVACHGPNAQGIGDIPRLGGLEYSYLKRRLAQWGEGYDAAAKPPMPRIASRLSPQHVEALASYLSFVQ
jgi:cytochrome c553